MALETVKEEEVGQVLKVKEEEVLSKGEEETVEEREAPA